MRVFLENVQYEGLTGEQVKELGLPKSFLVKGAVSFLAAANAVEMITGHRAKRLNWDFLPIEYNDMAVGAEAIYDIS